LYIFANNKQLETIKMENIQVEVKLDQKVYVDINLDDIIDGINSCQMIKRWNYIAKIINAVQLNLTDLTEREMEIIKDYLVNRLKMF
jgi:hypothetical protein